MDAGEESRAVVKAVGHDRNVLRRGQGEHFPQLGDAAHLDRARLQKIHRARFQQLLVLHERRRILAGCHRDAALRTHLRQARDVLWRPDRFLQPAQVHGPQPVRHVERLAHRPRAVHVQHQAHILAPGIPRGLRRRDLYFVQLDVPEPLADGALDVLRHGLRVGVADQAGVAIEFRRTAAAQQAMHRLSRHLAGDVPESDVDTRQAVNDRSAATEDVQLLLQFQKQGLDGRRIPADAHRRQDLVDCRPGRRDHVVAEGLAPTRHAVIGHHLHQQRVGGLPGLAAPDFGVGRTAAGVGDAQDDGFNGSDFHFSRFRLKLFRETG